MKYPELEGPYRLKEDFRDIYKNSKDSREAKSRFADWKSRAKTCLAYEESIDKQKLWEVEILNYFDYGIPDYVIEKIDPVCKKFLSSEHGIVFDVLRAVILYSTPATKTPKYSEDGNITAGYGVDIRMLYDKLDSSWKWK